MKRTITGAIVATVGTIGVIVGGAVTAATAESGWNPRPIAEQVPEARGDIHAMHKKAQRSALRSQIALEAGDRRSQTAAKRGKRGKPGPKGPQGPTGPQGPAGAPGSMSIYTVVSPLLYLPASDYGDYSATCTSGGKAISGGFIQADTVLVWANTSTQMTDQTKWIYSITNGSSTYAAEIFFVTVCAR